MVLVNSDTIFNDVRKKKKKKKPHRTLLEEIVAAISYAKLECFCFKLTKANKNLLCLMILFL